jgi:hypothetical protein
MPSPTALLKRTLIFVHRWLGVALSILFTLWFASGIVMMYWSFPEVTAEMRLQRAVTLAPETVRVSPDAAYAALGREQPPSSIRLGSVDGRPVYQFNGRNGRGGGSLMVFADDGSVRGAADPASVDRAATNWAGQPLSQSRKQAVTEIDQWTVAGQLRNLRPMFKYTFTDGQQVYVDGNTANVVQYTTRASRLWAWVGAIPHWMYFTPLRKHQQEWFLFVVYSSMIGTVAALMGVVIALWMYSPRKRYRYAGGPTSIPYKGWKRWHTIAGLVFGVVTTTWAFSGLLSMGPFPILDRLTEWTVPGDPIEPPPDIASALRGTSRLDLARYTARPPAAALALVQDFKPKELAFATFADEPVYVATNRDGDTRIIPISGAPKTAFDTQRIIEIVRLAAGTQLAEVTVRTEYDAYYLDRRREAPLPVIYARLNDPGSTRFYIDPKSGRIVGSYTAREWISRWLYHGLHSLDFPWLYAYRPLWDVVVITLMLGGTAICVTSLVLTWRLLVRKVTTMLRPLTPPATEDLMLER